MDAASLTRELASSAAAGFATTALGHPLDCVKVHLQTRAAGSDGRKLGGTLHCARQMLRHNGPGVFWRGVGPPLSNSVLMNTVMFVSFAQLRAALPATPAGALAAGAVTGAASAALSTPFDLVKVQAQLSGRASVEVAFDACRAGPRCLYTGHMLNMLREGVFTAVYLGLYDVARRALLAPASPNGISEGVGAAPAASSHPPLLFVAAASGLTGGLAWVVSYPFDVAKSLQQAQPIGTPQTARHGAVGALAALIRAGGWRALYRGVGASTARAVLVTSARLVTYEFVKASLP